MLELCFDARLLPWVENFPFPVEVEKKILSEYMRERWRNNLFLNLRPHTELETARPWLCGAAKRR